MCGRMNKISRLPTKAFRLKLLEWVVPPLYGPSTQPKLIESNELNTNGYTQYRKILGLHGPTTLFSADKSKNTQLIVAASETLKQPVKRECKVDMAADDS